MPPLLLQQLEQQALKASARAHPAPADAAAVGVMAELRTALRVAH
jgi:hypothetical protein